MSKETLELLLYIAFLCLMIYLLTSFLGKIIKGNLSIDKYHENILLTVQKGTREKLRAYALIKGYKNEQQLIEKIIDDEIQKDNDKLK